MNKGFNIWIFLIVVMTLPITVFAVVRWYERSVQALPVLVDNNDIADYELVNHYGDQANLKAWENKIVVANFFFTHCPVVCPKLTASMKKVQLSNKENKDLLLLSYTVDPDRDSVQRLQQFINKFSIDDSNWQLMTGNKTVLYRLARNSFKIVATDGDGGPNDFIHSEKLVLIDKQKRIRGYYDGTDEAEVNQLINDIKKLNNEN